MKQLPNAVDQALARNCKFLARKIGRGNAADRAKLVIFPQWSSTLDAVRQNNHRTKKRNLKIKTLLSQAKPNKQGTTQMK
jgi:hypothetical protein